MTTSTGNVTLGDRVYVLKETESAIALLGEQRTVPAWAQAAERLLGYSAADVVGGSTSLVLPQVERRRRRYRRSSSQFTGPSDTALAVRIC